MAAPATGSRGEMPLPPYGAAIREMVRAGRRPILFGGAVVVSLDWNLGTSWPRIVLPLGEDPAGYDRTFLAGLDLLLVYRPNHPGNHVAAAIGAVRATHPRTCYQTALPRLVERDQ